MRPNGPELSCGGEQPPQGSSLRGRSSQITAKSVQRRAAKSSTAGSVSLSDWLGGAQSRTIFFLKLYLLAHIDWMICIFPGLLSSNTIMCFYLESPTANQMIEAVDMNK